MKGLFLIPFLLLGGLPHAKARVDPAVHKICASVADYMGCVNANSSSSAKQVKDESKDSDFTSQCIKEFTQSVEKKYAIRTKASDIARLCREADAFKEHYSNLASEDAIAERIGAILWYWYEVLEDNNEADINEYINTTKCYLGIARSKYYPMPANGKEESYLTPKEEAGRWLPICASVSSSSTSVSAGLTVYSYPSNPSKKYYVDFNGARHKIIDNKSSRYITVSATDTVRYSGFTIPGQRGYVDCAWGGSSGASWDNYGGSYRGSNSGYCIAEEGTEDTVIPDTVRNQMWNFTIDCQDKTFDRNKDSIGWQKITESGMAMHLHDLLCPLVEELPVEKKS